MVLNFSVSWHPEQDPCWRSKIFARLGVASDVKLQLVLSRGALPRFWRWPSYPEIGALAECEGGLIFLGVEGTRFVILLEEIASVHVPFTLLFPGGRVLRIDFRDGSSRIFAFLEHRSSKANDAAARQLADRLERRRLSAGLPA